MKTRNIPYQCHVFICGKTRGGERKSCGDHLDPDLKPRLKEAVKDRGWKDRVRVSDAGCLGQCAVGPNIMIYPQKIWLSKASCADIPAILDLLEELVNNP